MGLSIDRENTISNLETNIRWIEDMECHQFPGWGNVAMAMRDALELLKEQEAKWIHREDLDFKDKLGCNHFHGMCGNCGFIHDFIDDHTGQYRYCPQCGRSVKWE